MTRFDNIKTMPASSPYRPSPKATRAPIAPSHDGALATLESSVPINPPPISNSTLAHLVSQPPIIKNLHTLDLHVEQNQFAMMPNEPASTHVQESVEIVPVPLSCERIFYSYIDDHTDTRLRTHMKLDQGVYVRSRESGQIYTDDYTTKFFHDLEYDHRLKFDFYSTTLYIFPKQRKERFISEIHYIPEHITIRYKTTLELLAAAMATHNQEHFYQNIHETAHLCRDIFYRI